MIYCKPYFHCEVENITLHKECRFYARKHPSCKCKFWDNMKHLCGNHEAIKFIINDIVDSIVRKKQVYINNNHSLVLTNKEKEE